MSANNKFLHINLNPGYYSRDLLWNRLLFVGALASIAWSVYFSIVTITIPYQIELREGTALVTTQIILGGGNPYIFESQPLGLNVYGIGYNLAVLPFAFLFGNTLFIHRSITFVFILLSALLNAAFVYKARRNISLALGCGAFIMTGLIGHGGIGAFPSAMGSFLFLTAVLTPFARSFDRKSLLISALAAIFSFYTKPYFVLAFGIVLSYLFFFVSKRKSLFFGALFASLFAVFFIAMRIVFPLYFINIIIGNIFLTLKSTETLVDNLLHLFLYFYPILTLAIIVIVKDISTKKARQFTGHTAQNIFDLLNWNQPFIRRPINYLFYSCAGSFLAFLLILGPHGGGNGMNYAHQLLTPLFSCWLFQKIDLNNKFRFVIVLVLLSNLFAWEQKILNPTMLGQKNSKDWAALYDYIESSPHYLNSQLTASKSVEMGLNLTDSGQTIIFYEIRPFPEQVLLGPSYEALRADGFKYTKSINRAIEKQRFDLIIITKEKAIFFNKEYLDQYYSIIAEIKIDMPQTGQTWTAVIWKPLLK